MNLMGFMWIPRRQTGRQIGHCNNFSRFKTQLPGHVEMSKLNTDTFPTDPQLTKFYGTVFFNILKRKVELNREHAMPSSVDIFVSMKTILSRS